MSLYKWLDDIAMRPEMYLPRPFFASLRAFIFGYETALQENHLLSQDEALTFLAEFSEFVAMRLPPTLNVASFGFPGPSWETAIEKSSANDQEAFELFFRLFGQFREEKPHS